MRPRPSPPAAAPAAPDQGDLMATTLEPDPAAIAAAVADGVDPRWAHLSDLLDVMETA